MDVMMLFTLHPYIFGVMIFFVPVFFISFLVAWLSTENQRSTSILRFAPSVMTSLGLLGTFWSLISSLGMLGGGIGDGGQIDMNAIAGFMNALEKVFYFSVMGIGSAIVFMFLNLLVAQKNSHEARDEKINIVNRQYELNKSSNSELKSQSEYLKSQNEYLKIQSYYLKSQDNKSLSHVDELKLQSNELKLHSQFLNAQNQSLELQSSQLKSLKEDIIQLVNVMQKNYDMDMLGRMICQEITKVLSPSLSKMALMAEQNQGDVIKGLIVQLKDEVLVPMSQEIAKTNQSTNAVIVEIKNNQAMNKNLITALNDVVHEMDGFIQSTQTIVQKMSGSVSDMQILQSNQASILEKFNQELQQNLAKIEPAITSGMTQAQTSLQHVINTATQSMEQSLQSATKDMQNTIKQSGESMNGIVSNLDKSMSKTLDGMKELQDSQDISMKAFNQELSNNVSLMKDGIQSTLEQAKDNMVMGIDVATKGMSDTIANLDDVLKKSIRETQDNQKQQKLVFDDFNQGLCKNISDMKDGIQEIMRNSQNDIVEAITSSTDKMKETIGHLDNAMQNTINNMDRLHTQQDTAMQNFNEELSKTIDKIEPAIVHSMSVAQNAMVDVIDTASQSMQKSLNTATQDMKSAITASSDGMKSIIDELDGSMKDTIGGMYDIQREQKQNMNEFNQSLSNNILLMQDGIEQTLQDAKKNMIEGIGMATTKMSNTMIELDDVLQKSIHETQNNQQLQKQIFDNFNSELSNNITNMKDGIQEIMRNSQNDMVDAITSSTDKMKEAIGNLDMAIQKTMADMAVLHTKQDTAMQNFNEELSKTIDKIEPAISDGMNTAKTAMTKAIEHTTDKMNTAMTGVIDGIAIKVVDNLGGVLSDFNEQMDTHLDRMNTGLEATGSHVKELLDTSAKTLKDTLGDIDGTLEQSSQKLQTELQAFRDEYQHSLTEFFTKQNNALEQTLGVQSQRLQATSEKLGETFDEFTRHQKDINQSSNDIIKTQKEIYEPLLNQMLMVAGNLKQGNANIAKELRDMQEHTQDINQALHGLGDELPNKFSQAFEKLNEQYIDRFNTSNQMLQKSMKEFTTAAAALLTVKMAGDER